jgi:hypothetical protein
MRGKNLFFFTLGAGLVAAGLWGLGVGTLTTFQPNTTIRAGEVNANFTVLRNAIVALEQPVGVSRLAIGGTIADGKVLKAQGGNLVWGDDQTGGAAFGASLTGTAGGETGVGFKVRNDGALGTAVRGEVATTGWGVRGVAGGAGIGVQGEAGANGIGVKGEAGTGGTGVLAKSDQGTALLVEGSIGVRGDRPAAFVHTAFTGLPGLGIPGNISGSSTTINNPLTNNDPNAILIVTPVGDNAPSVRVSYDGANGRWRIQRIDGANMPNEVQFNVLVIKNLNTP